MNWAVIITLILIGILGLVLEFLVIPGGIVGIVSGFVIAGGIGIAYYKYGVLAGNITLIITVIGILVGHLFHATLTHMEEADARHQNRQQSERSK